MNAVLMGEHHASASGVDQFSKLPDFVIHNILAFLPKTTTDAGRTSVLSKRWYQLWTTSPYLEYYYHPNYHHDITKKLRSQQYTSDAEEQNHKERILNMLESSIQPRLQNNKFIYRFQLHIDFPDLGMLTPHMDRWVGVAIEKNVAELDLYAFKYYLESGRKVSIGYSVPQAVLVSKTIRRLQLWGCKLNGKLDIELPCLQTLECYDVHGLDEEMFGNLIHRCPLIETLILICCNEVKSFLVAGLSHLKYATLSNCRRIRTVEIDAPTLLNFIFDVSWCYQIKGILKLNLSTCTTLRMLRLCGVTMSFQSLISILTKVEILVLKWCGSLECIQLPIHNLKKLVLNNCTNITFGGFERQYLLQLIRRNPSCSFSSMTTSHLQEVHLHFPLKDLDLNGWTDLKNILRKSCMSFDNLKLALYHGYNSPLIIHDNLGKVFLSSLYRDTKVWRDSSICISSRSYPDIIDDLLSERRLTMLSIVSPGSCKPLELLSSKKLNVQARFRWKNRWIQFCGFEVAPPEAIEYSRNDTWKIFLEEHSNCGYCTTTFSLKWRMVSIKGHNPVECIWDLDFYLTSLNLF